MIEVTQLWWGIVYSSIIVLVAIVYFTIYDAYVPETSPEQRVLNSNSKE